jgi:hypothetical protein
MGLGLNKGRGKFKRIDTLGKKTVLYGYLLPTPVP